jgi:5-methylcytosine-specific restriction endonuclease McrA
MQKYIKTYCDYFDIKTQNELICEACGKMANDIHHINGRGKGKDVINNLMALCRKCHERAHSSKNYVSKDEFQYIHNNFLAGNRKAFLK